MSSRLRREPSSKGARGAKIVGIEESPAAWPVCILNQDGPIMVQHNLKASPDALLQVMAPSREDIAGVAEWLFPWSWVADRCAREGSAFGLGPALYVQALQGGTARHVTIDAHTLAVLLRGGMLPRPTSILWKMRAPRDSWRRRMALMRQRAALLTHVQQTIRPYNRPEFGKHIASPTEGGRCAPPFGRDYTVIRAWATS